jgi:hypothetical protein
MDFKNIQRASELYDFLQFINSFLEDLKNDGEIVCRVLNDRFNDFNYSYVSLKDTKTQEELKNAVLKVLNNRADEIIKEIESL